MIGDGEYFSWCGYERSWKSDAMWVDLRPVRNRIDQIQRYRPGKNEKARVYNTIGECAAAILLGGSVQTKDMKGPDLTLASGDTYEVRTSFWGGSDKFPPQMASAKRGPKASRQKDMPSIWCVTRRYPDCYNGAWVCGVIQPDRYTETRFAGAGPFKWAWLNPWKDDDRFTHVAEVMQDELEHPHLQVGMPYRKSLSDTGIAEYLESYGFFRPTNASASTPSASSIQTPGSGTG